MKINCYCRWHTGSSRSLSINSYYNFRVDSQWLNNAIQERIWGPFSKINRISLEREAIRAGMLAKVKTHPLCKCKNVSIICIELTWNFTMLFRLIEKRSSWNNIVPDTSCIGNRKWPVFYEGEKKETNLAFIIYSTNFAWKRIFFKKKGFFHFQYTEIIHTISLNWNQCIRYKPTTTS